jgi:L-ribulose-5-phosphate 3-epimerase
MMLYKTACGILLVSLAAMLSSGCSDQSGPFERTPQVKNTLGIRLSSYGKYQDIAWEQLPSLGIRYVEIPVPARDEIEATQKQLDEHHLAAIMLTGKTDLSMPRCVEELMEQLRICKDMGVHYLFLSARSNGAGKEAVYERLWKAGEFARSQGVTIVLETHPDLMSNGAVASQTLRQIHQPNVRMNFDTGNIYYYNQDTTAEAELAKVIDFVGSVHLKDSTGQLGVWDFPTLGKGVVNFKAVIKLLNQHGFTGPFVIELEGTKGVEMDEAQTRAYVADSVAYLRSIAEWR